VVEVVEVKIGVPKVVVEFLEAHSANVREYLEEVVIRCFAADLDTICGDTLFIGWNKLLEKYGLRRIPEVDERFPAEFYEEDC